VMISFFKPSYFILHSLDIYNQGTIIISGENLI